MLSSTLTTIPCVFTLAHFFVLSLLLSFPLQSIQLLRSFEQIGLALCTDHQKLALKNALCSTKLFNSAQIDRFKNNTLSLR